MLLTVLHIIVLTIALLCLHLTYMLPKTVEQSVLYAVRLFLFVVFVHNIHAFVLGDLLVGYQYVDWAAPYGLLYGPMLYIGPITMEKARKNRKLFMHLLPFVIALFFYVIMLFSFEYRETYGIKHYMFLYTGIGVSLFVYAALLFKKSTRGSHRLMPVYAAIGMLVALIILIQKIGEFFLLPDGYSLTMSVLCYTGVLCALLIIYGESLRSLRSSVDGKEDANNKIITEIFTDPVIAEESRISTKEVWEPYVEQVENYMQQKKYLNFSFDIVTMSTDLKIPKYILNELFSHYYQGSFVKKINNLRVQYACKELENTDFDQNIDELWKNCGFKSRASFYRNFSQLMHCTPLAYREKQMLKK